MGYRVTTLNVNTIEPAGNTLTLGASGDTIVATDSVNVNTVKDFGGGYKVDAFTTAGAGTWTCPTNVTSAEILVVGGGGGAGGIGGGGGAGGVVHHASYTVVPAVVYDITVGAGGATTDYGPQANDGDDSVFNVNAEGSQATMTAIGGGSGAGGNQVGGDGGSGGGGNGGYSTVGGSSTQADSGGGTGYGNDGGDATYPAAGGGGGASAAGSNYVGSTGGAGGAGKLFSNFVAYGTDSSNSASTGSNGGYFGGGGGGGAATGNTGGAAGANGGGGLGHAGGNGGYGISGLANTGGGAGGGNTGGGSGGSGIVLIRYIANPTTLWVSNGSGNLSSVNSAFGDALTLISSQTADDDASVSFTSGIDSSYKEYIFKFYNIAPATDQANFTFQCSIDGGSNYNTTITDTYFRAKHNEANTETGLAYDAGADAVESTSYISLGEGLGNAAVENTAGELHLLNPASTTYVKNFYSDFATGEFSPGEYNTFQGGVVDTTTAVNAISFKMSSGNFDGTIMMYGVL